MNSLAQYDHYLPSLGANPHTVTISGFSGGAFMATHMHVIYSKTIKGAGIIAGGPFGVPTTLPVDPSILSPVLLEQSSNMAQKLEEEGKIDALSNLKGSAVWQLREGVDKIVAPNFQDAVSDFYKQ